MESDESGDETVATAWTIHPAFESNYEGNAIFHPRRNPVGQHGDLALGIPNIKADRFAVSFRLEPPKENGGGGEVECDGVREISSRRS